MKRKFVFLNLCLSILLVVATAPAWGHSFDITTTMGLGDIPQEFIHEDAEDFKGWLNLTITNTGDAAWGDFHFEFFQVSDPIDNVHFDVSPGFEPISSQNGLFWTFDNDVVGATLDLYFYDDPVLPGEQATFSVYTDNTTDQVPFFGTIYYPTPVPAPAAFLLFGTGLAGLVGLRKRLNRR